MANQQNSEEFPAEDSTTQKMERINRISRMLRDINESLTPLLPPSDIYRQPMPRDLELAQLIRESSKSLQVFEQMLDKYDYFNSLVESLSNS